MEAPGTCQDCGRAVIVQRWGLSVVEHWCHDPRQSGFATFSPVGWPPDHPGTDYVRAARTALAALSARCDQCFGLGIADAVGRWKTCPSCDGVGRVPTVAVEQLQDAHRHWFRQWPQYYRPSRLFGIPARVSSDIAHRYDGPTIGRRHSAGPTAGPAWPDWVVFHAPHASTYIPPDVRETLLLSDQALQDEIDRVTDHGADTLLIPLGIGQGAITASASRLVVDVERFLDDDLEPMARVGMGAIYTRTSTGDVLRPEPTGAARRSLLESYFHRHHERLTGAVDRAIEEHGRVLILDLHTFPDVPLPCDLDQTPARPDICIGTDAFHTPTLLRDLIVEELTAAGFTVAIDRPYAGTIVPQQHLHRDRRVTSVMIEVNRRLYLEQYGPIMRSGARAMGLLVQRCLLRAIDDWQRRVTSH